MTQQFIITGNLEFQGNSTSIKVQECDLPFWLTCDMNLQATSHQYY
jgi:hypothetical protein